MTNTRTITSVLPPIEYDWPEGMVWHEGEVVVTQIRSEGLLHMRYAVEFSGEIHKQASIVLVKGVLSEDEVVYSGWMDFPAFNETLYWMFSLQGRILAITDVEPKPFKDYMQVSRVIDHLLEYFAMYRKETDTLRTLSNDQ